MNGTSVTGVVQTFTPGGSNPDMPGNLYGLKVNGASPAPAVNVIQFDIFRVPTWGDFYAKDGNAGDRDTTNQAWNTGFLDADPTTPPTNGANFNSTGNAHILRPDTFSTTRVVREPSSLALLFSGAGVFGVFSVRRLRGRQSALAI